MSGDPMHALTLQQPWATVIASAGKDVENRTWRPPGWAIGRRIAIHAGLVYDERGARWIVESGLVPGATERMLFTCPRGAIVATAVVAGHSRTHPSPWFHGPVGWLLRDVVPLVEPVPCRGAQGLWRVPADVAARVLELSQGGGVR